MLNRLQDVFKSFQRNEVKYVVIGGIASRRACKRAVDLEDVRLLEKKARKANNLNRD